VLSWALSITLDVPFCLEDLLDQGTPFTSRAFAQRRRKGGMQSSMNDRGWALNNVFAARLWRTGKYFAPAMVLSMGYTLGG
jgi:putative transposase